jgi:thioredoxin reductase
MEARCVKQNQFDESRYRWFRNEQVVTGVKALNKTTNEALKLATGFFVAIGLKPNTDIFKDFIL